MKSKILCIVLLLSGYFQCFSQVGVGTTDPQRELHVAGSSSTIRIDGLNATNNVNNTGATNTFPIHVNASGDLVIPSAPSSVAQLINVTNPVSTTNLQSGVNGGPNSSELYTATFTLTKPGLVFMNYSLGFSVTNYTNTAPVNDGRAKIVQNYVRLGDGTTPDTSITYATAGQSYTNANGVGTISGLMFNNGTGIAFLPAGNYSIHVYTVFSGGSTGTTTSAFSVNYGLSTRDVVSVYVIY